MCKAVLYFQITWSNDHKNLGLFTNHTMGSRFRSKFAYLFIYISLLRIYRIYICMYCFRFVLFHNEWPLRTYFIIIIYQTKKKTRWYFRINDKTNVHSFFRVLWPCQRTISISVRHPMLYVENKRDNCISERSD